MPKTDVKIEAEAEVKAEVENEKWSPPLGNEPTGLAETAVATAKSALKSHDDTLRTIQQMRREPEPPKCYITNQDNSWSWAYAGQGGTGFASKAAVLADARANLKPLLDGNDEELNVVYEVVS